MQQVTQVQRNYDKKNTTAIQVPQKWHQSATWARVKNLFSQKHKRKHVCFFLIRFLFLKTIHNTWFCKSPWKKYTVDENHEELSTMNLIVQIFFLFFVALLEDSERANKWCLLKIAFQRCNQDPYRHLRLKVFPQ